VRGAPLASDPALAESKVLRLEDRLVLALPGKFLFPSQQSTLSERARQALFDLGGVLRNIDNQISVNGHSDPAPPEGGEYASNWELSSARANAALNIMTEAGIPDHRIAEVRGKAGAEPLFPDDPYLPGNRRLSITLLREAPAIPPGHSL